MKASVSKVKLFKSCRKAYWFKYVEDLEPVEKAEALQTGSSYHELIAKLYDRSFVIIGNTDYSKEMAMVRAYASHMLDKFWIAETEKWYEKPVGNHTLVGRVDGITTNGYLVEHKTTSSKITEEYEYNLQWDDQILAYMYLTGAREVWYTVIRKPTIRQKKNETDREFFYRMLDWYDEDTDSKIRLLKITRTDAEVEAFAKEFEVVCDEMERGVIYRNQNYCNCLGRRCEYSSICLNYDPNQTYVEFMKGGRK